MNISAKLAALATSTHVPVATVTSHYNHALSFLEKHTSCCGEEAVRVALHDTILEFKEAE